MSVGVQGKASKLLLTSVVLCYNNCHFLVGFGGGMRVVANVSHNYMTRVLGARTCELC